VSWLLHDVAMAGLSKALDLIASRERVLADNIANVDTPGFVPRELDFAAELRAALHREHTTPRAVRSHVEGVKGAVTQAPRATPRRDGNAVSIEREMSALAQNNVHYLAVARLLRSKFRLLGIVISERGI
jgi:flagellar basal-body rod protein FlgB